MIYFRMMFLGMLLLAGIGGLTACSTIHGAGEDLEKAGRAVQNVAR